MIQSVDRSLQILNILKEHQGGLGITELANKLDVAKSTIHRLVSTLESHQYIQRTPDHSSYQLGLKFIEMYHVVVDNLNILDVARDVLEQLSERTQKISHLVMIEEDHQVIYIDKVESQSTIRIYSRTGRKAPLHCTGVGKAISAYYTSDQLKDFFETRELTRFTDHTITSKERYEAELARIRESGYAIDDEEHEEGIRCIAVPIFDHQGKPTYAVSITGTVQQMTEQHLAEFLPILQEAGNEISKRLGYSSK
ncbi:IclR family transcriptional regulator [Alkalihalobacillus sp. CinArs1]|uniref:IclR family transcriptional regulator n=1 Tax=Alkalihalobacillus sp. CinArs1 TaxID=2995314 RepID=UPI0022DDD1D9|nr:IclR family transcriptional regulator [Alkalihalobacillus sp. CinArs1]